MRVGKYEYRGHDTDNPPEDFDRYYIFFIEFTTMPYKTKIPQQE
jgi:hypothetical protein